MSVSSDPHAACSTTYMSGAAMAPSRTARLICLLLITLCSSICTDVAHSLQFSYTIFKSSEPEIDFSINSNVDNQALQVTRNSGSSNISNTSGQITYIKPFQLWHASYNDSASFNTSFVINTSPIMGGGTNATGGGMTFMLSSQRAFSYLPNSADQWLGLFDSNATTQEAQIVAIEFDTFKDSFDPDANHVGIDVNGSVHSILVLPLGPQVSLTNTSTTAGINTTVWIEYDGSLQTLDVYVANQGAIYNLSAKPAEPVISRFSINLRRYLPETVYVGFSASMGTILEAHCVIQWNFTSTEFPTPGHTSKAVVIGCSIGGVAIALLVVLVIILLIRRRKDRGTFMMGDLSSLHYGPRKFPYKELKKATHGFSEECNLGQGGFGAVYKGVLRSNNEETEVAVKCLSQKSKQGEKEFKAEVMSIGRMRHKNLVQLLGWSYERSRLMLVYEFMPKGSLDKWIGQSKEGMEVMGWERRYHVMKGLAAGLLYLHEEWEMVVIHRDLKPSNVMLDADFNARIGDFGLAKMIHFEQDTAQTATIAGTPGYIAPECMEQGIISKETDIYSLGAIAIELATGRRLSINFLHSLSLLLENGNPQEAADPRFTSFDATQMELLLKLGLACCHPDPMERPSIRDVVHALSASGSSPAINAPSVSSFSSSYTGSAPPSLQITNTSLLAMEITAGR